jgi:hypothetical protein
MGYISVAGEAESGLASERRKDEVRHVESRSSSTRRPLSSKKSVSAHSTPIVLSNQQIGGGGSRSWKRTTKGGAGRTRFFAWKDILRPLFLTRAVKSAAARQQRGRVGF